jgi:Calpain family cysteine protease
MDDVIPIDKRTNKPAFNTTKTGEIWVMLLEKAWAKVHGGYNNIAAGLTREALHDLTGAPAITFFTQGGATPDFIWNTILEGEAKNFIMAASTDDIMQGRDDMDSKIGIVGSHAYAMLACYEVVTDYGN